MKKDKIEKKYAFAMVIVGTLLAFAVGTGIFWGLFYMVNSDIAAGIALNIGGLMGLIAFIVIPLLMIKRY